MADRLRVLLLDDDPDDRALIRRALQQGLPEVQITDILEQTGLDQAVEADDFDAVVTDYQLRWTDGLTVLHVAADIAGDGTGTAGKVDFPECAPACQAGRCPGGPGQ